MRAVQRNLNHSNSRIELAQLYLFASVKSTDPHCVRLFIIIWLFCVWIQNLVSKVEKLGISGARKAVSPDFECRGLVSLPHTSRPS